MKLRANINEYTAHELQSLGLCTILEVLEDPSGRLSPYMKVEMEDWVLKILGSVQHSGFHASKAIPLILRLAKDEFARQLVMSHPGSIVKLLNEKQGKR